MKNKEDNSIRKWLQKSHMIFFLALSIGGLILVLLMLPTIFAIVYGDMQPQDLKSLDAVFISEGVAFFVIGMVGIVMSRTTTVIGDSIKQEIRGLGGKIDKTNVAVRALGVDMKGMRTEMREMRTEMRTGMKELGTEMREMRTEMRTGMKELGTEMREMRTEIHKDGVETRKLLQILVTHMTKEPNK